MNPKVVHLKELRENIDRYVKAVDRGEEYVVMRRSTPIFKLVPPDSESDWETVIDFTKIKKGGVALEDVLARL